MKKLIVMTMLFLMLSTVTVLAAQEQVGVTATATAKKISASPGRITAAQKNQFKQTLRNYFSTANHGYGIGFTEDNYITAKWYISNVKIIDRAQVNQMVMEAKHNDETDWDAVRERVREALGSETATVKKGRIRISKTDYALTSIIVSESAVTADISELPDYVACDEAELSAEECETNAEKVGELSITRKASTSDANEPNVWAGTLTLSDIVYTFVTFAYPR
ncbi:MAG: hypothetical protein JW700_03200 [Candidatus Aenigmarchaeota archaeon]|nr:hypothetical protein [Candidatus Aenigmarchaeota archaeon]